MRRPITLVLGALTVLLLVVSITMYQKYKTTTDTLAQTQTSEQDAKTRYTDAFNDIAEIQDSLNAISVGTATAQTAESQVKMGEPNRAEALERISLLKASIQRTRQKIQNLEADLHRSGMKIAGLGKMIGNLKTSITEKEGLIADLTNQVNTLNTQVAGLQTTVQQDQDTLVAKNQVIEEKRHELGTIYYVIGSKQDLTKSGVIVAKGGVLGLGKTVALSGQFNESTAIPLDTDQETVVHGTAVKAQVISPQPASSYALTVAGNHLELRILDPVEFRKVKHLVIMTT